MGTVFKKTFTKEMPAGAETFVRKGQRFARWINTKGKTRVAEITTGQDGAMTGLALNRAPFYYAKYRDGSGIVRTVATGCRDETAARGILGDFAERRAELVVRRR